MFQGWPLLLFNKLLFGHLTDTKKKKTPATDNLSCFPSSSPVSMKQYNNFININPLKTE